MSFRFSDDKLKKDIFKYFLYQVKIDHINIGESEST